MATTENLSDAKRKLLERFLRGEAGRQSWEAPLEARQPGDAIPIAPSQQQIWLHSQMALDVPLYNEPVTLHYRGALDREVLERSFHELLRRHEIWRTTFAQVDGQVVQVVHSDLTIPIPLTDLSDLAETQRDQEALRIATAEARRPFDLGLGPLLRARLIKLAEDSYRLYITAHHIVFEGRCIFQVVLKQLPVIYEAFSKGLPSPLPEPRLQYADYAIWQKRLLDNDAAARQMDYWRQTLDGELPVLNLPADRPRPVALSHAGATEMFRLSPELSARLKAAAGSEGVTMYMLLLAAFKALLYRYSGQEDILIGGAADARRRSEFGDLVGFFLHTVALRTRPRGDLPFRRYLRQVKDAVLGAVAASDVPFDQVVREVQPKRDGSRHTMLQAIFSMEPPSSSPDPNWDMTYMDVSTGACKFDLYLGLDERADRIVGRFLYSTDIFEAATIRRMAGHWMRVLEGIAENPGLALSDLPLLTPEETRLVTETWNATARPVPEATVHELFENQAARTPQAVAVEDDRGWLTYRELNQQANRLALRLRDAGVRPDTVVGLCVDRGCDMVAALLAILKAGGAYLPLDPALPQQRLRSILEDADTPLILTERGRAEALSALPGGRVFLDEGIGAGGNLDPVSGPRDLVYVLYTSGSTGKPKGVQIQHASLVNFILSLDRVHAFTAADRLLAVTTLSFDIATMDVFLPLVNGGRLIVSAYQDARDPDRLRGLMEITSPTVMNATPATWRALLDAGWRGDPALRIMCGGEALPPELATRLLTRCAVLWNGYGPTETTIGSAFHRVTAGDGPVPIGGPIANTQFRILDRHRQLLPVGVPGELYIGGAGLARGYLGREDLTRERFVDLPGQGRFYRTGDLARWRPDGMVECLGRTDDQVKIRGFRVELGEIEAVLAGHPEVRSAAVRAWPDASGHMSLTAYVVAQGRPGLRTFLEQKLPEYMIPSRTVWLESLPLTPSGKVDRNRLPEPLPEEPQEPYSPLSHAAEARLRHIWESVLGSQNIGLDDNFFDLGGHSLLVAKLLRRVEAEFGVRLSMADVFRAPTLGRLSKLLVSREDRATTPKVVPIQGSGSRAPLFWINASPKLRALASRLGDQRPFLGVSLSADQQAALQDSPTIEAIAAQLVRIIRDVQPSGPYFLGGWCASGLLAYEAAAQLRSAGQDVAALFLLDTLNPVHYLAIPSKRLLASRVRKHARRILGRPVSEAWRYIRARLGSRLAQILPPEGVEQDRWNQKVYRAARSYRPPACLGALTLLQPAEGLDAAGLAESWADVPANTREVFTVAGDHESALDAPLVQDLASRVAMCLAEAENGSVRRPAAARSSPRAAGKLEVKHGAAEASRCG